MLFCGSHGGSLALFLEGAVLRSGRHRGAGKVFQTVGGSGVMPVTPAPFPVLTKPRLRRPLFVEVHRMPCEAKFAALLASRSADHDVPAVSRTPGHGPGTRRPLGVRHGPVGFGGLPGVCRSEPLVGVPGLRDPTSSNAFVL